MEKAGKGKEGIEVGEDTPRGDWSALSTSFALFAFFALSCLLCPLCLLNPFGEHTVNLYLSEMIRLDVDMRHLSLNKSFNSL